MVISVSRLRKFYKIYKRESGILGSLKSFVSRKYEQVRAVSDISFEITEGELIGFIGPNGAGKTTTLKCLSGLLYPDGGKVSVLGFTPFERNPQYLKQISLVMGQKNQLWWDLPVMDSLILNKEIYEVPQERFDEVVFELSKLLEVQELLNVQVKKLSLGQRMKCELIASLLHSPQVLFLDEPTIGLDIVMQKTLREFIKEYNKRNHATIILTSHYMGDVEALCKRIIIINFGKILYDGLLSNLIKKYAPYKIVKVIFKEYVDPKKLEELGEVRKFGYPELVLRVPNRRSNEIASKILKYFSVDDITIEEPEVEDIIRDVFKDKAP